MPAGYAASKELSNITLPTRAAKKRPRDTVSASFSLALIAQPRHWAHELPIPSGVTWLNTPLWGCSASTSFSSSTFQPIRVMAGISRCLPRRQRASAEGRSRSSAPASAGPSVLATLARYPQAALAPAPRHQRPPAKRGRGLSCGTCAGRQSRDPASSRSCHGQR